MMKWLLLAFALLFASPASAQSTVCASPGGLAFVQSAGCAQIPLLIIDGIATGHVTTGTTITAVISTQNANDVVMASIEVNGSSISVSTITDTAGLTWGLRKVANVGGTQQIEEWSAKSPTVLVSDTITVTFTAATSFANLVTFGVANANIISPFDPNALIPTNCTASGCTVSLTTTNPTTMLLATYRMASTASPTAGNGWTSIYGANFMMVEYMLVNSQQSATIATLGGSITDQVRGIGDAITK